MITSQNPTMGASKKSEQRVLLMRVVLAGLLHVSWYF